MRLARSRQAGSFPRRSHQIIFYSALIGLWALLAKLQIWPPYLFPPPWGVAEALRAGFQDHSFWIGIAVTMKRMIIGYGLSVILGMVLGLGVASNKFLEETLGRVARKSAVVAQHLLDPTCCSLVWFDRKGDSVRRPDGLVAFGHNRNGRWPETNAKNFGMAGRNLGASGFRLFWYVFLPASLPYIVSGLKQGMGIWLALA